MTKIVDGDTLDILPTQQTHIRIRLKSNAPEEKQAFYQVSSDHLATRVLGKNVIVVFDPNNKYDRWGRILGKVMLNDEDECLEQVKAGFAWHFKRYEKEQTPVDRELYAWANVKLGLVSEGCGKIPTLFHRRSFGVRGLT